MDNLDIFEDILDHNENFRKRTLTPVKSMNEIFKQLSLAQLTKENLEDISYFKEEKRFSCILENYDYKMVLRKYNYVDLMNALLNEFKPTRKEPYKKLAKAFMSTAKYLIRFQDFNNYRKHLNLRCNNDEHTLIFLKEFRLNASLPSMYFNKTCCFFQQTGLLDVPYVNENAKRFLMDEYNYPDNNEELYISLLSIAKDNHIRCYELNDRLDEYYTND